MEKNSRVRGSEACAVQGWVISVEEGHQGENSRVKVAQSWGVEGWVTS